MRIVYLHQYFNTPEQSGSTRSYEMARRWSEAGHDIHVVTSARARGASSSWSIAQVAGFTVHYFGVPYDNSMGFAARLVAFIKFALVSGFRARKLKPDVVFATSTPLTIIVPALTASIGRSTTDVVFEVRDLWPEVPIAMGKIRNPIVIALAKLLERIAYRSSKRIVALSSDMAKGVASAGVDPRKIVVAPNSCDFEMFAVSDSVGEEYRRANAWIGDRKLVVYCGTFGEVNGVDYLVRLAEAMKDVDPSIVFALYGSGRYEASTQQLAADLGVLDQNIFFPGEVAKKHLPVVLNASSAATSVVKPIKALEANSANKFFDALAASRPFIVNHGGWQADLLESTGAGISLDPVDFSTAARSLSEFMNDAQRVADAGRAAREVGQLNFDRDEVSARVLEAVLSASEGTTSTLKVSKMGAPDAPTTS